MAEQMTGTLIVPHDFDVELGDTFETEQGTIEVVDWSAGRMYLVNPETNALEPLKSAVVLCPVPEDWEPGDAEPAWIYRDED